MPGATGSSDVASTSTSWEENVSYHEDDVTVTSNVVGAYTKQKKNLAARWDALRSTAYRIMAKLYSITRSVSYVGEMIQMLDVSNMDLYTCATIVVLNIIIK